MKPYLLVTILGFYCCSAALAQVDEGSIEDPAHNEIRALRDDFLDAFEKKDIDRMLSHLDKNVVITVQNSEVLRGHDAVRDFHNRMSEGDNRAVQSLKSEFKVDELSILYGGDTAVAFGDMNDHFVLSRGMEFDLHSRWTATLVKPEAKWQVAAFHVSTNMFDNGVSNLNAWWAAIRAGGIALLAGFVGGAIVSIAWYRRKVANRSPQNEPA